jgi:hypothetical protein
MQYDVLGSVVEEQACCGERSLSSTLFVEERVRERRHL